MTYDVQTLKLFTDDKVAKVLNERASQGWELHLLFRTEAGLMLVFRATRPA